MRGPDSAAPGKTSPQSRGQHWVPGGQRPPRQVPPSWGGNSAPLPAVGLWIMIPPPVCMMVSTCAQSRAHKGRPVICLCPSQLLGFLQEQLWVWQLQTWPCARCLNPEGPRAMAPAQKVPWSQARLLAGRAPTLVCQVDPAPPSNHPPPTPWTCGQPAGPLACSAQTAQGHMGEGHPIIPGSHNQSLWGELMLGKDSALGGSEMPSPQVPKQEGDQPVPFEGSLGPGVMQCCDKEVTWEAGPQGIVSPAREPGSSLFTWTAEPPSSQASVRHGAHLSSRSIHSSPSRAYTLGALGGGGRLPRRRQKQGPSRPQCPAQTTRRLLRK